jgi:hypothetical protein
MAREVLYVNTLILIYTFSNIEELKVLFKKILTVSVLYITCTATAHASFHSWEITELFSNVDGTIQYIELFESKGDDDQNLFFTDGAELLSNDGPNTNLMSFSTDLPSNLTASKFLLIGTAGYAALDGAVTPDYILPDNFLFTSGGTVDFGLGVSEFFHGALPTDGILSLYADGSTGANSPTNFLMETGSIDASAVAAVPVPAAAWLFGSGLLGLVGVARRKKA